jgi:hypothetical protein
MNRIAKLDGTGWTGIGEGTGGGFNDSVNALTLDAEDNLIAGGSFDALSDGENTPMKHIAKLDGTGWTPIGAGTGGGFNDRVYALTADSAGSLIAAGWFTQATDQITVLNGIAKLDNGGAWASIGGGFVAIGNFNDLADVYALLPTPMLTLSLPAEAAKR